MSSPLPASLDRDGAPAESVLSARGLHKSFGPTPALRGLDVDVARGEVLAVTGPSGSGKSTLLHCLAGVTRPDAGTIRSGGVRLDTLGEAERAEVRLRRFGFVFQFGQLLPDLTARDNVTLPLLMLGRPRRAARGLAQEWLDRLGVGEHADRRPAQLSGGQAQRVAIARALVSSPEVVFADEPTGSLDSLTAERVMGLLLDLVQETATTIVLVTHDARTAAHADREVVVRDGRILGSGAWT